jgi:hypothetical protein
MAQAVDTIQMDGHLVSPRLDLLIAMLVLFVAVLLERLFRLR